MTGRPFGLLHRALRQGQGGWPRGGAAGAAPLPPGVRQVPDQAYGAHPRQVLDLYLPADPPAGPRPVILFVHGGGWRRGDKAMPGMVDHKLAHWVPRGWAFAAMNYRLWPEVDVLAQCDDVAQALAWLQRQAPALGLDARRLSLLGHSAGAQLAALLVASPARVAAAGATPWHATVVVDTAALDMVAVMQRPHYRFYDPVFGTDPGHWAAASATRQLQGPPVTPVLLVHGAARADAQAAAEAFAQRARALGGQARVLALPLGHLELNAALGRPGPYTEAVDAFLAAPQGETPHGTRDTPF